MALKLSAITEISARELAEQLRDRTAEEVMPELAMIAQGMSFNLGKWPRLEEQAAAALLYIEELEAELDAWKSERS